IFNLIRKRKGGYLNVNDVLSLSSIMFRMKSNSLLLMIITTLSALSIALLSLSYISYYSVEKTVERTIPADFTIPNSERAMEFTQALEEKNIDYTETATDLITSPVDLSKVMTMPGEVTGDQSYANTRMIVISEQTVLEVDVEEDEVMFINSDPLMEKFMQFQTDQQAIFQGREHSYDLTFTGTKDLVVLSTCITYNFPVAVVDDLVYKQMQDDQDISFTSEFTVYHGVNIVQKDELEKANDIFNKLEIN